VNHLSPPFILSDQSLKWLTKKGFDKFFELVEDPYTPDLESVLHQTVKSFKDWASTDHGLSEKDLRNLFKLEAVGNNRKEVMTTLQKMISKDQ
jgi:hypothetical protein